MASASNPSTPKSWSDLFDSSKASADLDKIHDKVANLFSLSSGDPLSDDESAKRVEPLLTLDASSLLLASQMDDELTLLHNITKIGGDLLNPLQSTSALPVLNKKQSQSSLV